MVAAFKKCDGVVSATASKEKGQAEVTYDPAKSDPARLVKCFNTTGAPKYSAAEMDTKSP